jgi:hypothetical protein
LKVILQRLSLALLALKQVHGGQGLTREAFEVFQNFVPEVIVLGLSIEYHARASPSVAITNDLAKTLSLPPADATTTSKLMMNWRGSDLPLYFGKVIGL